MDKESKILSVRMATDLFSKIIAGEKWADRLDFKIDEQWTSPHLAYNSKKRKGCVRVVPHSNQQAMASWIAHEAGHMDCYENSPPCRLKSRIESIIRSDHTPLILQAIIRKLLYLVFWRLLMKEELCAHKVEIRLLQKIGMPLEAVYRGDEECDKLPIFVPYSGFIERLYMKRMQKAQDILTEAVILSSDS